MHDPRGRIHRLASALVAAIGLVLLLAAAGCRESTKPPPNIVIAMVDTLRADYLGLYGFEGAISPNLDRLAKESVVFDRCFAQSPWTKPAVASLITSLYPQVHGLTNHEGQYWGERSEQRRTGVLPDQAETLAEILKAAGYATAGFVANPWVKSDYGFGQGFDRYDETATVAWDRADSLIRKAREWIESLPDDRPFFVYLHFMDVHAPYGGSREDFDALADSPSLGERRRLDERQRPDRLWKNIERRAPWVTEEMRLTREYWRTRYASGVRAMDRRMGELLEFLRERERMERTLLVVTSDHGEELFEHRGWSHGQNLYEHQLRVPLLIHRPGGEGGGTRVEGIVELVDLMPTLLDAAGTEPAARAQGRPLFDVDSGASAERAAFATATQRSPGLFSVRTGQYKLHHNVRGGASFLYDLRADPHERQNLARREPERTREMERVLEKHLAESLAGGTLDAVSTEMPEELQERLRALGYLE